MCDFLKIAPLTWQDGIEDVYCDENRNSRNLIVWSAYLLTSQISIAAVSLSLALHAVANHRPQWLMATHTTPLLWPYSFCTSRDNVGERIGEKVEEKADEKVGEKVEEKIGEKVGEEGG